MAREEITVLTMKTNITSFAQLMQKQIPVKHDALQTQ